MKFYEVEALLEKYQIIQRDSWEQARLIAYCVAQSNSSKKIKLTDITKFPWEKKEAKKVELTLEDKAHLRMCMDNLVNSKNKENGNNKNGSDS